LARFYPGCRQCPHRDDTGTLPVRQVKQLLETQSRASRQPLFHAEGAAGVYLNDLTPQIAREMAAALGAALQRRGLLKDVSRDGAPLVVLCGDGRPMSCELVAAVGEGLRWAGCQVVDIGPATAACLSFAIGHLAASGGILVGNPGEKPQMVGLKFWAGRRPLSADGGLEALAEAYRAGIDRPTRRYGPLRRFQAEVPYLADLAGYYHALRPLRVVLGTYCGPLVGYLRKLTESLACQIIECRTATATERLSELIVAEKAHFGVTVGDDGETCRLYDEQGRQVPAERLLLLVAGHLLSERPQGVIVLEERNAAELAEAIRAAGGRVVLSGARRAEMAAAVQAHGGLLGGGPSGRLWYDSDGLPLPDALRTLTLLLVLLSQSDRPLSEVLDDRASLR
jgi:phosphomannomutase